MFRTYLLGLSNIYLIDGHALLGERRCVVNGYFVKLRMRGPVLVQYQEKLLGSAERENGNEATASSRHDVLEYKDDIRRSKRYQLPNPIPRFKSAFCP